jgi:hypothetical protein
MNGLLLFIHILIFSFVTGQDSIKISPDFPGGNIVVDKIEKNTVWLKPDLSFTEGEWFYWYFKVSNIAGRTITFKFIQENVFAKYGPAYSINNDHTWKWYGENRIKDNGFSFSFSEHDSIAYFSVAFPYVQKNLNQYISNLTNKESLEIDTLCLSPEGRIIEKISIPSHTEKPQHKVLITARHHACEMMANYVLEGIIDGILNDKNLSYLRDSIEFFIIPFMDKDGVENGEQGKNRIPRDHNRDYDEESIHNSTAALRNIIPTWSNGELKIALDLHCPWIYGDANEDIYIVGNANPEIEKKQIVFSKLIEKYANGDMKLYHKEFIPFGTAWNKADNYSQGMSFTRLVSSLSGFSLIGTLEFPYANVSGVPVSKDAARIFGKAIAYSMQEYLETIE